MENKNKLTEVDAQNKLEKLEKNKKYLFQVLILSQAQGKWSNYSLSSNKKKYKNNK